MLEHCVLISSRYYNRYCQDITHIVYNGVIVKRQYYMIIIHSLDGYLDRYTIHRHWISKPLFRSSHTWEVINDNWQFQCMASTFFYCSHYYNAIVSFPSLFLFLSQRLKSCLTRVFLNFAYCKVTRNTTGDYRFRSVFLVLIDYLSFSLSCNRGTGMINVDALWTHFECSCHGRLCTEYKRYSVHSSIAYYKLHTFP